MGAIKGFLYVKIKLESKGRDSGLFDVFLALFPFDGIMTIPGIPYLYSLSSNNQFVKMKKRADKINRISLVSFILAIIFFLIGYFG